MSESEKIMKSLHRIMQKPGIWFGDYCIRSFDDDQFVLEHKSGEAMVLDKNLLEPKLDELWRLF